MATATEPREAKGGQEPNRAEAATDLAEPTQAREPTRHREQVGTEQDNDGAGPTETGDLWLTTPMPAQADVHMTILESVLKLNTRTPPPRLGPAGQQPRRDLEQVVRGRAVQFTDRLLDQGYRLGEVAERLRVNPRTLRRWVANRGRPGRLADAGPVWAAAPAQLLGRPLGRADGAQQQAVISWLDSVGPGVGVPTLRTRFEDMARAELEDLVKAYRQRWRAEHMRALHVLHWQRPGTVWAMDFAEAPCAIDGLDGYLLAVRDLASGQQLRWQPVAAPTAEVVLAELSLLFALHGAPWVLKTDNGSAFLAEALRWWLHRAGVFQLFSPPRTPAYNGSIEASIGSLKTRTQQQSDLAGHPGWWSGATVEAARVAANTTARPRRLHGQTPAQVWEERRPCTTAARALFQATVERFRGDERAERGLPAQALLTRTQQAAVDRQAIRRALVAHDLLLFRRRRIPPRITRPKMATKG